MVFGTERFGPEDTELLKLIELEAVEKFQDAQDKLRTAANQQIAKVQEKNQRRYNRRRVKATKYQLGDLVAIKCTQLGPGLKLAIRFLGPYRVTRCDQHDRYAVEKVGNGEGPSKTTTSADLMKPWRGFRDDLEADLARDQERLNE